MLPVGDKTTHFPRGTVKICKLHQLLYYSNYLFTDLCLCINKSVSHVFAILFEVISAIGISRRKRVSCTLTKQLFKDCQNICPLQRIFNLQKIILHYMYTCSGAFTVVSDKL